MTSADPKPTRDIYSRVVAVLNGQKPDRLPFIDRLELWHTALVRCGTLPDAYRGLSLTDVHRAVGIGQERMIPTYKTKLHGVEVIAALDGEEFLHETAPELDDFPRLYGLPQPDKPGTTITRFITPIGTLTIGQELLPSMVASAMIPYRTEPFIKEDSDFRVLEYILERAEYIPQYARIRAEQQSIGEIGFVLPTLPRIPFQQILIDYAGEVPSFYMLHDSPKRFDWLLKLLDEQMVSLLERLADFDWPMVEFLDNLEVDITNPRLFKTYCLPLYQKYADILHGQGKKMGSHTDGNLKPLLGLLAESGLDVCESISPYPLTPYTFEDVWNAWRGGPIIWGGIPSPILEARISEAEFQDYVRRVLEMVGDQPIILGVGDMVLDINLIERVHYIAEQVEAHVI